MEIKVIRQAVRVKNAVLIQIEPNYYVLNHYNTTILEIEILNQQTARIIQFKPVSRSSIRAINQALKYLGDSRTCTELKTEFKKAGLYVPPIGAY